MMKHKRSTKRFALPRAARVARPAVPKRLSSAHHAVRRRLTRRKGYNNPLEALTDLPRITNETVAEHREEILGSARKYIYPLQHSRGRIVKISASLLVGFIVIFFAYCGLALYKFQSTSTFVYEITRVIPFPIARAGSHIVSYESYLFELRHLTHYYETQQKEDFSTESGRRHMTKLKQDALQKVVDDAYVKKLAATNNITVSNRDVSDQIELVKSQNRLGSSDQMLGDVLKQFWGWSIEDFRRELKSQLLAQKVASVLDTTAHARAANALAEIDSGADFAAVAAKYSDDEMTKAKGGQYPAPVAKTNRDVPPQVVGALFSLQPGKTSRVVDTGYSLEIVKSLAISGDKVQGAHISFKVEPIASRLAPLKAQSKTYHLIKV